MAVRQQHQHHCRHRADCAECRRWRWRWFRIAAQSVARTQSSTLIVSGSPAAARAAPIPPPHAQGPRPRMEWDRRSINTDQRSWMINTTRLLACCAHGLGSVSRYPDNKPPHHQPPTTTPHTPIVNNRYDHNDDYARPVNCER